MREITIAIVQMKPDISNSADNLVKMSEFVATITAQQKVDLIVFPELITTGYELGVKFTDLAQRVPGPAINLMAQRAADAGVYIAFGLASKEKVESIIYNSAVLVGPEGELLGMYHKVHLKGEERMAFREGFKMPVIDTDDVGKIGLMIGWDLAFPEVARAMVLEGAEILCVLANWETTYIDEWKTYLRSRAYENAVFMVGANRVGEDVTMTFGGESMIIGPRGNILAQVDPAPDEKHKDEKSAATTPKTESKVEIKADEKVIAAEAHRGTQAKVEKVGDASIDGKDHAKAEATKTDAKKSDEKVDDKKDDKKEAEAAKSPIAVVVVKPVVAAEGYCIARVDLDEVRRYREEFQTLQARKPTVYRTLVKRY